MTDSTKQLLLISPTYLSPTLCTGELAAAQVELSNSRILTILIALVVRSPKRRVSTIALVISDLTRPTYAFLFSLSLFFLFTYPTNWTIIPLKRASLRDTSSRGASNVQSVPPQPMPFTFLSAEWIRSSESLESSALVELVCCSPVRNGFVTRRNRVAWERRVPSPPPTPSQSNL